MKKYGAKHMYSALKVAEYIIGYCNEKKKTISNLKLQKVLYFVQAQFLVNHGQACFEEEIEAWDFGPVVPSVYHKYKIFGSTFIPIPSNTFGIDINDYDKSDINAMVDACSEYSATELVNITHNQDPWKKTYRQYERKVISNELIREFFSKYSK